MAQKWQKVLRSKPFKKKFVRYFALVLNVVLVATVVFVVVSKHQSQAVNNHSVSLVTASSSKISVADPLDKLSASDIAVSIADVTNIPEAAAVRNQAETVQADLAVAPAEDVVAAKPQVVATALKDNQDIQHYTVQQGDTVGSLAKRFDVTSDSIMWSNNLSSGSLQAGSRIYIPPISGIVYKVKSGDTPQSLAQKYSSNAQQIISFNNAELSGLKPGELIVIPNGQVQPTQTSYSYYGGFSAYGFTASYGSDGSCFYNGHTYSDFGYACGWCTWYAAWKSGAPSDWGNATSWAYYASITPGWRVSSVPTPGAIVQTTAGDHVGIVDQVSANGQMVKYSDMNGLAGWGRVGYSGWVPAVGGFDGGMSDTVYISH